jgi:hypothetical protein
LSRQMVNLHIPLFVIGLQVSACLVRSRFSSQTSGSHRQTTSATH